MTDVTLNTAVLGPDSSPGHSPVSSPGFSFMSPDVSGLPKMTGSDLALDCTDSNALQDAWLGAYAISPVATPLDSSAPQTTSDTPVLSSTTLVPSSIGSPCVL